MKPGILASTRRAAPGGGTFDPLTISWHTAFWAEDPNWTNPGDGNAVAQWDDATGSGRHATEATDQPIYRTSGINGQPALEFEFDGSELNTASWPAISQPNDVFVVVDQVGTTGEQSVMDTGASGARCIVRLVDDGEAAIFAGTTFLAASPAVSGVHAVLATFNTTQTALLVDGTTIVGPGNAGSHSLDRLQIGHTNGSRQLVGFIAFLGVKDGALTAQERSDLLAWSQSHYGTP